METFSVTRSQYVTAYCTVACSSSADGTGHFCSTILPPKGLWVLSGVVIGMFHQSEFRSHRQGVVFTAKKKKKGAFPQSM